MNKITKFLFIVLITLLVVYFLIKGYTSSVSNIADKVGAKVGGGELSVNDYYALSSWIQTYKNHLVNKDYETAYNMLASQYRNYISYDNYLEKIHDKNFNDMIIKEINIITATTYDVLTEISGEDSHYSLIIEGKTNKLLILPDSFLDYKIVNMKESSKKLECVLKDYIVDTNKCIMNFQFINNSKDKINITNSVLTTNLLDNIENYESIEIMPGETKDITIEYKTDYAFPSKLTLYRNIIGKDKQVKYVFDIDK